MPRFLSSIFVSLAIVALSIVGYQPAPVGAAANATLTYSGGTSLKVGESVTVTVNVAVSEFSASSIRVTAKYDPSFFENVSVSDSGSAFNSTLSTSIDGNTGTITSSRFKQGEGVTGNAKVLDITLKAKKEGSTSLSFTSNSKIWESNTGVEKPLASSATHSLTISNNVTNTPTPSPDPTATPTPTAAPTQNPTSKPTARVTAKPTAKPTTSTSTPAPSTGSVSAEQSTVSFNKTTAAADGIDAITVTVTLRDANASIITSVEPSLSGLRDGSDTALPFTLDSTGLNWETNITSVAVGTVSASVAASGTTLATQDLTFTEPIATSSPTTDSSAGSSFGRLLLIGGLILLLLLLLLFFLWKKLRGNDDDDSVDPNAPAFPGDSSGPAPGTDTAPAPDAAAATPPVVVAAADDKKEEPAPAAPADTSNASFNAAAALQRAEEPKQDTQPPEQSINL